MVKIKTRKEIEIMKEGGRILAGIMDTLKKRVAPGVTTKDLDRLAYNLILKAGAKPAFLEYEGFPATLCTSLNEVIVHGVPSERILQEGDILKLDLGIQYKGYFADMAVTVAVGKVDFEAMRLIRATKKALKLGIKKARPGNTVGDIGNTIQRYILSQGFDVIRELCGHGIGKNLHEDPQIPNFGKRHQGEKLVPGMVICIEPMVSQGDWRLEKTEDNFGYRSWDRSLTCHFEHTIAILESGPEILTKK